MDKIILSQIAYDHTRQLHYKLVSLDDEKRTLLLTVWGKTEEFCNILSKEVMDKLTTYK